MAQQETAMQGAMSAAKSKAGATPRAAAAPARLSDATIVELMADAAEDTDRDNGERLVSRERYIAAARRQLSMMRAFMHHGGGQ